MLYYSYYWWRHQQQQQQCGSHSSKSRYWTKKLQQVLLYHYHHHHPTSSFMIGRRSAFRTTTHQQQHLYQLQPSQLPSSSSSSTSSLAVLSSYSLLLRTTTTHFLKNNNGTNGCYRCFSSNNMVTTTTTTTTTTSDNNNNTQPKPMEYNNTSSNSTNNNDNNNSHENDNPKNVDPWTIQDPLQSQPNDLQQPSHHLNQQQHQQQHWMAQQQDHPTSHSHFSPPLLPHPNDDAMTLLQLSRQWFHYIQQQQQQQPKPLRQPQHQPYGAVNNAAFAISSVPGGDAGVAPTTTTTTANITVGLDHDELDQLGQVVTAYATKLLLQQQQQHPSSLLLSSSSATPSSSMLQLLAEPFLLWLQATCHAEDTSRAFQALIQWHDFELQLQQHQQPPIEATADDTVTSKSSSLLSGLNLLRHFASLSPTSTIKSPFVSIMSSSSLSPPPSSPPPSNHHHHSSSSNNHTYNSSDSNYYYTPVDCATMVWTLQHAIQRQKANALALDPRWNMNMECYYHIVSSLSRALFFQQQQKQQLQQQPFYYRHLHPQPRQRYYNQSLLWERLVQIMSSSELVPTTTTTTNPSTATTATTTTNTPHFPTIIDQGGITTPEQMTWLLKAFHESIQTLTIKQQQQQQRRINNNKIMNANVFILRWSEQLHRHLFVTQPQQVVNAVTSNLSSSTHFFEPQENKQMFFDSTVTATDSSSSSSIDTTTRTLPQTKPAQVAATTTTTTQVHPMLLQALQLEHNLQQQQQWEASMRQSTARRKNNTRVSNNNNNNNIIPNPHLLGPFRKQQQQQQQHTRHPYYEPSLVSMLSQISAIMQHTLLMDKTLLPELERAQVAMLILQQLEALYDQVMSITTTATTTTTTSEEMNQNKPLKLPLPTIENYLIAWHGWIPMVFRHGQGVRQDEFIVLENLFQRMRRRKVLDKRRDVDTYMDVLSTMIRGHCGLNQFDRAASLLEQVSERIKDADSLVQPELVKHRQIVKDLWNRLISSQFQQGNYKDVVRLCHRMASEYRVFPTEITRTLQLQSLAELAPTDVTASSRAVHTLHVMLNAFRDYEDLGKGSYAPPPTAKHYLAVLTSILRTPEVRGIKLVQAAETATQVLDMAEAEGVKHVQRRFQQPDKPQKYDVDQLLTIPEHYETVMAIWERCRSVHRPASNIIESIQQRLEKRKAGAIQTFSKPIRRHPSSSSAPPHHHHHQPHQYDNLMHHEQQHNHQLQFTPQTKLIADVDVLLERTRNWSRGQNILQLVTLLEDWLAVILADEATLTKTTSSSPPPRDGQGVAVVAQPTSAPRRNPATAKAIECMQLLLAEWVEVLGQASRSNLWDSSYPSDHTNRPFRILLQAYRHLGDGPAAFEVLNDWQRALASHWSLSPDVSSLHLVLEAYTRQQSNSPKFFLEKDAIAGDVSKLWELLQRWHASGRVNLQIETISHVVKCLTLSVTPQPTKPIHIIDATPTTPKKDLGPNYLALRDRLITCFDVVNNLMSTGNVRPTDLYFLVRAYCDALHCADTAGDDESVLAWSHALHNTIIRQPKELIEATLQLGNSPDSASFDTSFEQLMTSAYEVVQQGIFSSPNIDPKEKSIFLQNIVEELDVTGSSVGGLASKQDYLRAILAIDAAARATEPYPTQEEWVQIAQDGEGLLKNMKEANESARLPFLAFRKISEFWCHAGNTERAEAILRDASALQRDRKISHDNWLSVAAAWNFVFQSYFSSGQANEAFRLYFVREQKWHLDRKSWCSLIEALPNTKHSLTFQQISSIWMNLENEFREFYSSGRGVPPTEELFALGMKAICQSAHPLVGEFVDGILGRMVSEYARRPSREHFAAAISAWLLSANTLRFGRAEFLISKMSKLGAEANLQSYTNAMKNLAFGKHEIGAVQAELMLDDLYRLSSRNQAFAPDRDCYIAVIDAWLQADSPYAAGKAQAVLDQLELKYEQANRSHALQPPTSLYERLILKWGHTHSMESGIRAEKALSRWEALVEEQGLERSILPYAKAIQATQRHNGIDSVERLESLLDRVQKYFSNSHPLFVEKAINEAMLAWTRCSHPEQGVRAWNLYKRISKNTDDADNPAIKDRLGSVLHACAFAACNSNKTREETLKVALLAYEQLNERKVDLTSTMYKQLIQSLGRHLENLEERNKIIPVVFQRCCAEGKLDAAVLDSVKRHAKSCYKNLCTGPEESLQIPSEWCRNVQQQNEIHKIRTQSHQPSMS